MSKKFNSHSIRQGDILVRKIKPIDIEPEAAEIPRDRDSVVLAYGEVSGHRHRIDELDVALWECSNVKILTVGDGGATLAHEEHSSLLLDEGTYEVLYQYEYQPSGELRQVID